MKHPLSQDVVIKLQNFEFIDNAEVRAYLHCNAVNIGTFSDQNGFDADRVAKQFKFNLDESEALSIAENCVDKNEQGSPADVWSFRVNSCLMASKLGDQLKSYTAEKRKQAV